MSNYLPFQGAENVSVPDDLNGEMPVQRFAFGGIANPSQQAFLSKADREYLQARQVDLDKLAEYDRAVEAYNRDVYAPYEKAYGEYEKAINTWNEGPRTTDYAGPSEPTLSPFTIAKPEVSFDPQAVVAFQKAAAQRAQEAAGQRGLAIDVVSDPGRYNLGALSVSNAFMAEGGEVKAKDMLKRVAKAGRKGDTKLAYVGPEARAMLKSMGGSGTVNPRTGLPEYALGNMASDFRAIAAQPPPPPPPPPPQPAPEPAPAPARSRGSSLGGLSRFSRVASSTPAPSQRSMKTFDARLPQGPSSTAEADLNRELQQYKKLAADPAYKDASWVSENIRNVEGRLAALPQQRSAYETMIQDTVARGKRYDEAQAAARPPTPKYDLEAEMQVVVYGPDGKMYSSPRAARDAGVTNYTTIPPKSSPVTQPPPGIDTRVGPPLPPPGGMPVFNPNDPFRDINNPRPVSPPPGGVLPGPVMGPPAPTPPAPAPAPAPAPTPAPPPAPTPSPVSPVPSPFTPVPTPRPAPTPPSAGYLPGTIRYNPVLTYQGPTAVDLLQQDPSLAPKPAGGLPNMGYTTDRLGNIIRAPMAIPVFARGGDVDTNELLQRVNEYNLYGDDPAYYSESRNMLNALPVDETTYSESPSKIQVKRVRGQELRPKSSEGFGKGMAMEVESLTTSKGASPKALKGTAKDDFMELARTYKLKAKEAESMARGLSRDTFNAPTLERPTLTKGSLTKRRFEEGGEVKKSSQESEKEAGQQFDDPIRSGKPLQRRTRRAATQEENEALNRAVLQGAANMPYNLVGAPVDIANMVLTPAGLGSERPVMGSDWIKQKMTDLGVRPEMPTDPTQRALYSAADIGSSLVNPAAPVRAAARGAEKAGEAARMLAEDFQQYNRALGPAGASYAIKPKGGNWLKGPVEEQLAAFKMKEMTAEEKFLLEDIVASPNVPQWQVDNAIRRLEDEPKHVALNQWIDRNLTNYVKKEMGTVDDPVRLLAEQGVVAKNLQLTPGMSLAQKRTTAGMPPAPVSQTAQGQAWEDLTDRMIDPRPASFYKNDKSFNEGDDEILAIQNPWIYKVPDETQVYTARGLMRNFGFDHVVDVLREDLASGRIQPNELKNVGIDRAVRRTYEYDQDIIKAAEKAEKEAMGALLSQSPLKEYDSGFKWVKLPDPTSSPEAEKLVRQIGCQGGWCTQDAANAYRYGAYGEGNSLFVLLDPTGRVHGQVHSKTGADPAVPPSITEVKPRANSWNSKMAKDQVEKDPQYQEKIQAMMADFIRSGTWKEIGDLQNAGLVSVTEGQRLPGFSRTIPPGFYSLDELRQMAVENEMPQEILDTWMSKLGDQLRRGYAQGGLVDTSTAKGQLAKLKAA